MTSFSSKAKSAVIWNTGFNLFRDVLQFITMLVLVRILHPESYGEFALVTSVIGFLAVFSHENFIAHILQVQHEEDTHYQDHFSASAVMQVGIFLVTNLVALGLLWLPKYAPVAPYVHVMSIGFLLEWPCELRRRMIERDFDWKRLRLLHAVGLIAGAILAPLLAWGGAGTYALLIPGLFATLPFVYDLFFVQRWRPTWGWSWLRYRPAFSFGLARLGSGLVVSARRLLESGVLTAVFGFAMLGLFGRAIGLSQIFCQKFSSQLMTAIYPIITRISGRDGDNSHVSALVLQLIAWVAIPSAVLFMELAESVVRIVYGGKWNAVTPLLVGAMFLAALSAIGHASSVLLLARGHVRTCLAVDVGVLFGTGLALLLALPYGLKTYLLALCMVQAVVLAGSLSVLLSVGGVKVMGIVTALAPPVFAAAVAWGWLVTLEGLAGVDGSKSFIYSVIWGAAFGLIYLAVLRVFFQTALVSLLAYCPARDTLGRLLFIRKFP